MGYEEKETTYKRSCRHADPRR